MFSHQGILSGNVMRAWRPAWQDAVPLESHCASGASRIKISAINFAMGTAIGL